MTQPGEADTDPLDVIPAAHTVTDLSGRIVRANSALRAWTGAHVDLESAAMQDLLTPASCLYFETVLTPRLSLQGSLSDIALELGLPDGVRHTVWAACQVGDDALHWVGIDVTERRHHERELVAAQRRLARLQRLSADILKVATVESMSDVLLSHLVDGVKADRGVVAVGGSGDELRIVAGQALGAARAPASRLDEEPLIEAAFEHGQPLYSTSEPGTDPSFDEVTQRAAIPLAGERRLGVVLLDLTRATPHSGEEKELLAAAVDITASSIERARLLRRLEVSADRNATLSDVLHVMEAETSVRDRAQKMAERFVPTLCDLAVVTLDELGSDVAGVRHAEPAVEEKVRWLHRRVAPRLTRTRSDGEPERRLPAAHAATGDQLKAAGFDEVEGAAVRALGATTFLRIPLVARSRTIGTLSLGYETDDDRRSDGFDEFLGRLADACALSLDNARLYEHEQGVAQQLQAALLPESLPADSRFSLHWFYQAGRDAMQVGGDWYDAFLIDGDRLGVMVGDVVGRGVSAARSMGKIRTAALAFAQDGRGVSDTLAGLHRFAATVEHGHASSAVYAEVDLRTGEMEYGYAGHPPAVVLQPGAEPRLLADGRGSLLGLQVGPPPVATTTLTEGSSVVMYTDGLVERRGQSIDESIDGLVKRLHDEPGLALRLERLARKCGSHSHGDDSCILTLRLTEAAAPAGGS